MTVYEAMQSVITDTMKFVDIVQDMRIEQSKRMPFSTAKEKLVDEAINRWIDDIVPKLIGALERENEELKNAKARSRASPAS
jgi:hypothetical protein